ncbi:hypothetical protein HI914_03072 [Erysiphe necator]|nr:hypothetical protein HI914_03072 [Erysiphe necator]
MISGSPANSQAPLLAPNPRIDSSPLDNSKQEIYTTKLHRKTNDNRSQDGNYFASAEERVNGLQEPSANLALKSYRKDIMSGIKDEKWWLIESKGSPQENSSIIDSNNPIQTLILLETALNDSKNYEILSPEEVEEMKIKCESITRQIKKTRQDLVIQSKYSDATDIVTKLYSSNSSTEVTPENLIVQRDDQVRQHEQEFMESERRCEELAINLFRLEKELMITQGRILRHTSRILQLNYEDAQIVRKSTDKSEDTSKSTNKYNITQFIDDDLLFDERSLYRALEGLGGETVMTEMVSEQQVEMIKRTQQKLVALNHRIMKIIKKLNGETENKLELPPSINDNKESLEILQIHLGFLEENITTIDFEQEKLKNQYNKIASQNKYLLDEKEKLQRQIQQYLDQKSISNSSREAQRNIKIDELPKRNEPQATNLNDIDNLREQVNSLNEKLVKVRQKEIFQKKLESEESSNYLREADKRIQLAEEKLLIAEERARSAEESSCVALTEIKNRDQRISRLEEQLQKSEINYAATYAELESKMDRLEIQIKSLENELASVVSAKAELDKVVKENETILESKDKETNQAQMDIARLQTELTIAKADLDIAYGSRAQRAAQMALNPIAQSEIDRLKSINDLQVSEIIALKENLADASARADENVKELRKELTETIEEYEKMTKASIEWEKEREQLEETIDNLREAKEKVEAQFSDEKVQWIGIRSPNAEALSPNTTTTTILKNEFKKMIRDIRAENAKVLKAEQFERRRLEEELRSFRKTRFSPNSLNSP